MCLRRKDSPTLLDVGNELQRRGPKGHFQGSRKEFLESQLPAYLAIKKGSRQNFWHKLFCAWWQRFPWKLSDEKEPPTDEPEKMAQLASVEPGEEPRKQEVEKALTAVCWILLIVVHKTDQVTFQRLTRWFSNHATATTGGRHDTIIWFPLVQQLHQLRNPRPRCRTVAQQFMADHPDILNTAFASQYSDGKKLTGAEHMNLRTELAKKLVSGQHANLVSELEKKAAADHEKAMNEWQLTLENVSEAEDVSLYVALFLIHGASLSYISVSQCPRYAL